LIPAPPGPAAASVSYDESSVTIEWPPSPAAAPLLKGYHVYEIDERQGETRLTEAPTAEAVFSDRRMDWGRERCYTVRAVHAAGSLALESEPSPPACATLVDRFPPPPPTGLIAVASEAAINLIWEPSPAPDVAGYVVSRGRGPDSMKPLTPAPIAETTFRDAVESGVRYAYIVTAVDQAGNVSGPSERVEETAR
jgi:fibronectin type 3 domain-containing protein